MNQNYKHLLRVTLPGFFRKLEDILLVSALLLMIMTAVAQIVLRNVFGSGIVWADSMVRILVLWCGLLGATVATREKSHISIDLVSRYIPERAERLVSSIIQIFTGSVSALMAFFSLRFVQMEFQYNEAAFASVPAWLCQSIIPAAFAVTALRCLIFSLTDIHKFLYPEP